MDEFEKLLKENLNSLQRYVNFKINNKHDAEDVLQDVCLSATMKFQSLNNTSAFKPWLLSIANHKINDYYRKKAKVFQIPLDSLPESALGVSRMGIKTQSIVVDALDKLGDKEKQIIYLYYFKNYSQYDISKKLSLPIGTVKSRLHYAKEKFKKHYPHTPKSKGENIMKRFPDILPEYKIEFVDGPAFPVVFEELPNWFIIPRIGQEIGWADYAMPDRKITEKVHSKVVSPADIHGVEGVEILTEFENLGSEFTESSPHIYYAQLTESHCRWLGASYIKNGKRCLLTFLDGDDFISEWGYGENNCGSETHLVPSGVITRDGNTVSVQSSKHITDVVGRYKVCFGGNEYDTVCTMEYFDDGALTEQYIDRAGRTVLWRRFNKNDWAYGRYGKLWTEMLPDSDRLIVNGEIYVHWSDCISDYVL